MHSRRTTTTRLLFVLGLGSGLVGCLSSGEDSSDNPFTGDDSAPNNPPTLSGSPPNSVQTGDTYRFVPNASDADGDTIAFSIANKPGWADFDDQTGELSGRPSLGTEGTYPNITISASDGKDSSNLRFSITVTGADRGANRPPSLSGSPPRSVSVGTPYQFVPTANDPDGDPISFSVDNLPAWASFDSQNGRVSGTPAAGTEGIYNNVAITVSDGSATDTLMFSIEVTTNGSGSVSLSWTAPTENVDGSPLTNLAGFKLYYGIESGNYTETIDIDNPSVNSYIVDNLNPTTYYFVATAYNSNGIESDFTDEVQKTAN